MRRNRVPVVTAMAGVLVAFSLSSCSKSDPVQSGTASIVVPSVKVLKVALSRHTPELVSFGSISYRTETNISASVEGTVVTVDAHVGDRIRRGEPLATLRNVQLTIGETQAESQLTSAKAAVEVARAQLWQGREQVEARILSLQKMQLDIAQKKKEAENLSATLVNRKKVFKVGGISPEQLQSVEVQYESAETAYKEDENDYQVSLVGLRDSDIRAAGFSVPESPEQRNAILVEINTQTLKAQLDAAQASVKTAESNLAAAQALVAELTIDSPVTGIIGARQASVGERLSVGDKLYTVIEDSKVYAVFPVPENQAMTIVDGMPVDITVPALGNRVLRSTISTVSPLLDPQSGNLTVRSLLSNSDSSLKPGLFIRVRIQTGATRKVILIPESAFASQDSSKGTLFLVRDGHAFKQQVTVNAISSGPDAGKFEVRSGLAAGDIVIDEPSPVLQDGEEVHVKE